MGNPNVPAPHDLQQRLRALIQQHGENEAIRLLDVHRHTVARALAGMTLQRGTLLLLSTALNALEGKAS